jgi:hypothetical protein
VTPQSPFDPETEFEIGRSQTPVSEDGYKLGEPKTLSCRHCSAEVLLTPDPGDPGVDDLSHDKDCPQRWVRSEWWTEHLLVDKDT